MGLNPKALAAMKAMQDKDHGRTGTSLAVGIPAGPVSAPTVEGGTPSPAPTPAAVESTPSSAPAPTPEPVPSQVPTDRAIDAGKPAPTPASSPSLDPKPAGNPGKPLPKPAIRAFGVVASAPKEDRIVFSCAKDIAKFVEKQAARRSTTMTAVWMEAISFPLPAGWWEKQFVKPGIKPQAAFRQYHKDGGKRYQSSVVCVPQFRDDLEAERRNLEEQYSEFAPKLGQLVESHITVWALVQAGIDPMAE